MHAQQSITEGVYWSGRKFSVDEVRLIQQISRDFPGLSITELSRTVCELLQWKRPNGRLKNHECRLLLEHLHDSSLVSLPELRPQKRPGPRQVRVTPRTDEVAPIRGSAGEFEPLELEVVTGSRNGNVSLWAEWTERYHYLGCRVPVGANLRYLVRSGGEVLACLLWTSPAWKMAARDRWIGWTDAERRQNLQLIVNNARFLILPWVQVRNLASTILSRMVRRVPDDWEKHYGYRPFLFETLVDRQRFRGTCYRAANWIHLGQTRGRGRMDRDKVAEGRAVKDVYVYPLCRDAREQLRTAPAPMFTGPEEE